MILECPKLPTQVAEVVVMINPQFDPLDEMPSKPVSLIQLGLSILGLLLIIGAVLYGLNQKNLPALAKQQAQENAASRTSTSGSSRPQTTTGQSSTTGQAPAGNAEPSKAQPEAPQ